MRMRPPQALDHPLRPRHPEKIPTVQGRPPIPNHPVQNRQKPIVNYSQAGQIAGIYIQGVGSDEVGEDGAVGEDGGDRGVCGQTGRDVAVAEGEV